MPKALKPCKEGQERDPTTKRCRKIKAEKVKKVKELKPCKEGQERDPTTKRCRKIKVAAPPVVVPVAVPREAVSEFELDDFENHISCEKNDGRKECSLNDILNERIRHFFASDIYYNKNGCTYYKKGDQMGEKSMYGTVYYTCCEDINTGKKPQDCGHITKIVRFDRYSTVELFKKEVKIQHILSLQGIAPRIEKVYLIRNKKLNTYTMGIIVMEKMEITLKKYMIHFMDQKDKEYREHSAPDKRRQILQEVNNEAVRLAREMGNLIKKIHEIGYFHGDLHMNNVMFKNGKLFLIDFGLASKFDNHHPKFQNKFFYDYRQLAIYPGNYFEINYVENKYKLFVKAVSDAFKLGYFQTIYQMGQEEKAHYRIAGDFFQNGEFLWNAVFD